ncbi:MAG: GNAT family N-acetyltransferase [Methyloglobulus sp.]|nr:GNAT family N-acetyltransferase [Methyloglobulus sp.]
MKIISAGLENARDIAEIHVRSWQQAYRSLLPDQYLASLSIDQREEFWLDVLASHSNTVLIAVENNTVAGFLNYQESCDSEYKDSPSAEILAFYVEPSQWRKGVGTALWQVCKDKLVSDGYRTVSLWVVTGNTRAIEFYEAQGFRQEPGMVEAFELAGVSLLEQKYAIALTKNHEDIQSQFIARLSHE